MDTRKRKKLEAAGWRVGSAEEFLGLTPEEAAFVETRLALSRELRRRRTAQGLSQSDLAKRIGSSQSRIAKAEASDPGVSMDLLVRALFAIGATPEDLAATLGQSRKAA
jgi:DNA-binding XRE family transcriptional regulator